MVELILPRANQAMAGDTRSKRQRRKRRAQGGRPSDAVGCVRSFHLKSGGHLRERLLALSDRDHLCTCTILESPMPMSDYVSTIQLLPVTDADQTYAHWTGEFNCAPDVEPDLMNTLRGVYQGGFDFLKNHFGPRS